MIDLPPFEQVKSGLFVPSRPAIIRRGELVKPVLPAGIMVVNGWLTQSAAGGATPTFVAVGAKAQAAGTLNVPYYAGLAANDIAIMIATGYDDVSFGTVSGWTAESQVSVTSAMRARLYWKRLAGSESGTESITGSTANANHGVMIGFRGCITSGTPYEAYNSNTSAGNTSVTSPSTTTTGANRLLLRVYTDEDGGTNTTPPAGWTEQYENWETVVGFNRIALDTLAQASAATVSATSRTASFPSSWVTLGLALLPTS